MRNIWRGLLLILALMLVTVPTMAMSNDGITEPQSRLTQDIQQESDDASVRVIPDEAVEGSSHTILITGLEDNEFITVRIVSNETGNTVYETDVTANNRGSAEVSIFSEDGDAGEYTVEALNASGDVIGSDDLIILATPELEVMFSVEPLSADIGEVFEIELSGAEPFAILELEVRTDTGNLVYSMRLRATVDGDASFEFNSGNHEAVGELTVTIIQNEVEEIAQSTLTVTGQLLPAVISFSPETAMAGDTVFVTVTGVEPETDISVIVSYEEDFVDIITESSNVSGLLVLPYEIASDALAGDYDFEIQDNNGETIALGTLSVGGETAVDAETDTETSTADISAENVVIDPLVAVQGERVEVIVNDLPAGETVTLQVTQGGEVVFETERTVNPDGTVALGLATDEDDATGVYELNVIQDGTALTTSTFELVSADEAVIRATLEITPESAPTGTDHVITVADLAEGQSVEIVVTLEDETVFETTREAGTDGTVVVVLSSDAESDLGVYDVTVTIEDTTLTGSLEITEGDAEPTTGSSTSADAPVLIVDPASGPVGTEHTIIVTGLEPNEEFFLIIGLDDETVFTNFYVADENGDFETVIFSEETDPAGEYDIIIVRGDNDDLTATLTIEGDEEADTEEDEEQVASEVEITVSPESAELGGIYEFTVTGLEADADVDVVVEFDGEVLFETTRTANEDGEFTIILETSDEDELGEYTFIVVQDDDALASVEFEAVASDEDAETDEVEAEVEVTVEPESAELGEIYLIEVTGLDTEEDVVLFIEFDGEVLFETVLTADDDGVAQIEIVAEEGDEAGEYTVIIERDGDEVAETAFEVIIADDVANDDEDSDPNLFDDMSDEDEEDVADEEDTEDDDGENLFARDDDEIELSEEIVTLTGELTEDSPQAEFVFSGEEGQQVTINLTSEDFDTFLVLLNDDGAEIAFDDDGGEGLNSRFSAYTLPYTGEYTIVVSSFDYEFGGDGATGDYEVSVSLFVRTEVEIELGEGNHFVNGTFTEATPETSYIFEGDEGDTVVISLNSADADTYLFLLDENGNQLAVNDDSNGTLNSQIGPFELPYDGEYTVIASTYRYANFGTFAVGSFTLSIETVEAVDGVYDESVTLEFDEDVSTQFIYFEGQTGDIISVSADSDGSIDTTLTLTDANGFAVASDDDGGAGFDPEIERVVLGTSGTYILQVSSFTPGDEGEVEVTISLEDSATLDVDEVREVRLNEKLDNDVIYIDGVAGETITLEIELVSGDVGALAVIASQDFSTLMRYETQGVDGTIVLTFDVDSDGEISIFFQENFAGNAIFNVEITRD